MKKRCISNPTKSLIFYKSLLLFQNKAKIADSLYSYKFICVYIVSFYANIAKFGTCFYHCRYIQSKSDKESHVDAEKSCFDPVLQMDIFPECRIQ